MGALTFSTLKTRVRRFVGDVSSDTTKQRFSDTLIEDAINDAVNDLASDGLLKRDTATDTVVAGDNEYIFPTDAYKIYRMTRNNKVMYAASMTDFDQLRRDWEDDEAGEPAFWFPTTARNWKFYPKAGTSYVGETITHYFFDIPATLSVAGDTPDFANEFHIAPAYGAAAILLQMDRRLQESAPYEQRFSVWKTRAVRMLRRMEDRAKDYRMSIDLERGDVGVMNPVDRIFKGSDW